MSLARLIAYYLAPLKKSERVFVRQVRLAPMVQCGVLAGILIFMMKVARGEELQDLRQEYVATAFGRDAGFAASRGESGSGP